ncbi:hypothetical protein [Adlercreutzia caecimuris]|uniref:hypothetical protein n=1 Tax=Adlercreutzia caecimuris TaxID=671266 RepID=UPI00214C2C53|nr:hypothetical protein [Adlercreutzia caecimuris]MCR2037964.1 hypothetical protein [Adlercreutzia caecimuris]
MSIDPTRDPHARIVVKPLPSQVAAAKAKAAESAEAAGGVGAAGAGATAAGGPAAAGGVGAAGVGAKTAGGPAAASGVGAAGVGATAAGATGLVPPPSASPRIAPPRVASDDPFLRAANEDDDGYDPYSDRPAPPEPLFQEDPWA